jgi:hypothetical protein
VSGERRVKLPAWPRLDARVAGALLCTAGVLAFAGPSLLSGAIGLELIATAFWCWARASEDPARQVARWNWLRRPAGALWLAVAIHAVAPALTHAAGTGPPSFDLWRAIDAAAVAWAGLELVAALPLARPFSDLPGPLVVSRPWLPVLIPSAGFVVLWQYSAHWTGTPEVRAVTAFLLLVTAVLAGLRAFARRGWIVILRWLVVSDCALAGLLVAVGAVPRPVSLLLWVGACGSHAFLLAAELRGSMPRRGMVLSVLWRLTGWISVAALSWPMLLALGSLQAPLRYLAFGAAAVPVLLVSWITVGRLIEAEERRAVVRRDTGVTLSHLMPLLLLGGGPALITGALWTILAPRPLAALLSLIPALLGGGLGILALSRPGEAATAEVPRRSRPARALARAAFRSVVASERRLVAALRRAGFGLTAPLRDLHSGDAQEYLLLLVGVGVLAIVLPLLR